MEPFDKIRSIVAECEIPGCGWREYASFAADDPDLETKIRNLFDHSRHKPYEHTTD